MGLPDQVVINRRWASRAPSPGEGDGAATVAAQHILPELPRPPPGYGQITPGRSGIFCRESIRGGSVTSPGGGCHRHPLTSLRQFLQTTYAQFHEPNPKENELNTPVVFKLRSQVIDRWGGRCAAPGCGVIGFWPPSHRLHRRTAKGDQLQDTLGPRFRSCPDQALVP